MEINRIFVITESNNITFMDFFFSKQIDLDLKVYLCLILWRVSEWLLFNANLAIFQLYHGENKLIFNEMMMRSPLY
jgi:hypothetical protein